MRFARPVVIEPSSVSRGSRLLSCWEEESSIVRELRKEVIDDPGNFMLWVEFNARWKGLRESVASVATHFHEGESRDFVFDEFVGPAASQGQVDLDCLLRCRQTSAEFEFALLTFEKHIRAMWKDLVNRYLDY